MMNKQFNSWKDYLELFLIFFSSWFLCDLGDLIYGKIKFKEFCKQVMNPRKKIISFIGFIILVIFTIAYEILDLI